MRRWFLTRAERGNPASAIDDGRPDAWTAGNHVRPLVHGATYFACLHEALDSLRPGDGVYFTDWRGDADEQLVAGGPTIGEMLCRIAREGVAVRGLIWRSHTDLASFSGKENAAFSKEINDAGGQVQLDQRVRLFGSHHQKLFVIRHRDAPERDIAFVGGIDLCHARRDDVHHEGDPQHLPLDQRYGTQPPWHDVALEIRGPAVGDVLRTFTERWDDPTPLDRRTPVRMLEHKRAHLPRHPPPLPERPSDPPPAGRYAVQVLRTYGARRPRYPYAPRGERSVARAYAKAFDAARSLIYVEDQYLWSELVANGIARALRRHPSLRLIVVVPRYPDKDGRVSGPPNRLGQLRAIDILRKAGGDRVAIYDIENEKGTPIYVHAKVCIVDDVWFTVGSDNFNRRSWTNDSEITCAVIDTAAEAPSSDQPSSDEPSSDQPSSDEPAGQPDGHPAGRPADDQQARDTAPVDAPRRLPLELRAELWAEHLGVDRGDDALLDHGRGFDLWQERSAALDAWHDNGRPGERPPGRVRRHEAQPVGRIHRLWATPVYRIVFDPDGRPWWLRRTNRF
jgi:phosphatidylserine/phosphatidylglycerophosphate/cardiolipin synthase-like enzyme